MTRSIYRRSFADVTEQARRALLFEQKDRLDKDLLAAGANPYAIVSRSMRVTGIAYEYELVEMSELAEASQTK